jgi:acyl carrier protein
MKSKLLLVLPGLCFSLCILAQEKSPVKFGKITPEDFKTNVYSIDSNASAVIIADIGSTVITGNDKGWFSQVHKHYRRAHILNKNGYDLANVKVEVYSDGEGEVELEGLKAVTYNLENGKVIETKLDKGSIFRDKIDKHWSVRKFTFPDLKEGSIIEFEYTTKSDFLFTLTPWEFQGNYPRLWSEYEVSIPEFFNYVFLTQGYHPYHIKTSKARQNSFAITDSKSTSATDRYEFRGTVVDYRLVMKDVPALKEESYTSTLDNHIAKVDFQLSERRYPLTPQNYMGTWTTLTTELLKDERFGADLTKNNGWLKDIANAAVGNATTAFEKAKRLYDYIRDNFTCTGYDGDVYMNQTLKNVLKNRNGSPVDINLLLIATLKHEGLQADPVILSTRRHGYAYPIYPILGKFNYVIAQVDIEGKRYYLDASQPRLGFGKLNYDCYNGHARIVNDSATSLEFIADSITEKTVTSVFLINDENGNFSGSMQQTPGYYQSNHMRDVVKEKGKEQLFAEIKKAYNTEIELSEEGIDSLDKYEGPVGLHYKFGIRSDKEDIIYFNPMLTEGWKSNPFKAAKRYYPVEMPYAIDETFLLRMDVPAGYVVDELPKQLVVKLNEDGDGTFEYRIAVSNEVVSLRSRLRIKRTFFQAEEYDMLREFFNLVVKKHAEQIVFKKKQ